MGIRHSSPKVEIAQELEDEGSERPTPVRGVPAPERNTTPPPLGYDGGKLSEPTPIPLEHEGAPVPASSVQRIVQPGWLAVACTPNELRSMPLDGRMAYVVGLVGERARLGDVVDGSALGRDETTRIVDELVRLGVLRGST